MTTIHNEIMINSSIEKIWSILATPALLDKYDPTVKKSVLVSGQTTGIGAKRRIDMLDGKNWFEEEITVLKQNEALTYQLTDCTFPIKGLKHSYAFERTRDQTIVRQTMAYTVKFGLIGKLLDAIVIRKQFNSGIRKFLGGLKKYAENN